MPFMIESLIMTLLPISFLIILIRSGEKFRRKDINMDGKPPIERTLFLTSKYLIVLVWAAAALHSWGIILPFNTAQVPKWLSLFLWISGFCLL
jgi:hypothetical protein